MWGNHQKALESHEVLPAIVLVTFVPLHVERPGGPDSTLRTRFNTFPLCKLSSLTQPAGMRGTKLWHSETWCSPLYSAGLKSKGDNLHMSLHVVIMWVAKDSPLGPPTCMLSPQEADP